MGHPHQSSHPRQPRSRNSTGRERSSPCKVQGYLGKDRRPSRPHIQPRPRSSSRYAARTCEESSSVHTRNYRNQTLEALKHMDKHPAVLLMAYGSPNSLDEVGEYLRQVRGGRLPAPEEVERLRDRYRQVGGQTPLLKITLAQAKALEEKLQSGGLDSKVYVGMKHWHPFIEDVVEKIVSDGTPGVIGLALAPHYSRLSIGGYTDAVNRGLARSERPVPLTMVESWHDQESLITALSRRVHDGLEKFNDPSRATVL